MTTLAAALDAADRFHRGGDIAAAIGACRQAMAIDPASVVAAHKLGTLFNEQARWDDAMASFRQALTIQADHADSHFGLAAACQACGRLDDAAASYRRAIECEPTFAAAYSNLGIVLKQQGRFEESVPSFERAVALRPDVAQLHYNLANTYSKLYRLDLAEAAYRRALELAPRNPDTHNNLGNLLQLQGRASEALAHFDAAIEARPDFSEAHHNRSEIRLLTGDFARGWPEYEWRLHAPGTERPPTALPRWLGQPLAGRTVLLWGEQGLGDTIQMIRYAPLVRQYAAARVAVQCRTSLHPLLSTAPGIDQLVGPADDLAPFDCFTPLLSLPAMFGTELETVPAMVPYLFAEPSRIDAWRQTLASFRAFNLGIVWQGNPTYTGDRLRSIPLEHFAPLTQVPNVQCFSLQKGPGREQLAASKLPIVDLAATLDETGGAFLDTAAVMMNLDLVITSDTAVAHLAGALGVPVWLAVQFWPNWRWLLDRSDSPWYPTMRLFRQTRFGEWPDVFARLAAELRVVSSKSRVG